MEEESFLKWAAELGILDSSTVISSEKPVGPRSCLGQSLCVSNFPDAGGRGLAAVRDLRKGELILKVPKCALMTSESLMKDQTLSAALQKCPFLSSTQKLTVALLYEVSKGRSSGWYPYVVQFPRSYDTLASFGHLEIQSFQVNDAVWAAEKAVEKAKLDWEEVVTLMGELKLKHQFITFNAWLWASASVSSRTMHIPGDDAGCLCPVGDFFNYAAPGDEPFNCEEATSWGCTSSMEKSLQDAAEKSNSEECQANLLRLIDAAYEEEVGAYCFYARRNCNAGEQVLLSYGTYTNLELLEHYGFILDENPNDKVFISLEPDMYSLCPWIKDSLFIHHNGKPSFALLSALRLWAAPPNQRKSVGHLAYSGRRLSNENEVLVMQWLAKTCRAMLKNFQTSIEEDKYMIHTINLLQEAHTVAEFEKLLLQFKGEVGDFLSTNYLNGGNTPSLFVPKKIRRTMERWKLAVRWRLKYKEVLFDCCSHCNEIINSFSCQNNSSSLSTEIFR